MRFFLLFQYHRLLNLHHWNMPVGYLMGTIHTTANTNCSTSTSSITNEHTNIIN